MEWMSLNDLREKYLTFFESKSHLRLASFPLIPQNDNSLLLINSGMAPMKKFFTGEITPPKNRVTTCQKCIRTPDIERVGKTSRHGTYFEMLGNFSFGDYFKKEATAWAWEFCTEVLEMPADRIWITIYENDDEAFEIWTEQVGVSPDRIVRLGKEDNFWEHGTGPCGPCSELHFDRGENYGCSNPNCGVGCDCDRYVEFWNLVFTQFDSDGKGNYTPLDNPNIDTGMGLERLACITQGVDNLFEVDTVQNIMKHLSRIADVEYKADSKKDVSMRVITDHIRSTCFMIGDGVMPSNEGRGYVLRRLLRRAARHGRLLGINRPFLVELCDTVIDENKSVYTELFEKKGIIKKVVSVEEENFERTIDQGLQLLNELVQGSKVLSGEDAFKLYDTYGFPLDLTKDILEEKGLSVDEDTFLKLMAEQRERARSARKGADSDAWKSDINIFDNIEETEFCGYSNDNADTKVLAIIKDSEQTKMVSEGDSAFIVLEKTPFYAESGGQVGDTGNINVNGGTFTVKDTVKNENGIYIHSGVVSNGVIKQGDKVVAEIDVSRRSEIRRNHTAAHLLQAALRKVLGTHVEQAGQFVNEKTVRFDFTHFSALTKDEILKVEEDVNNNILTGYEILNDEMSIDKAKAMGALALFGEKYGDIVRVVAAADKSIELCGGTHIDNTAKIGLFKIVSESSVASGVRRIEAVTGINVLNLINRQNNILSETAAVLKIGNPYDVSQKAQSLLTDLKQKDREIEKLQAQLASGKVQSIISDAKDVGDLKLIVSVLKNTEANEIRAMCDKIKAEIPNAVAVIAGISDDKLTFSAACGTKAVALGANAGKLVREIAKIAGGSGGGKADSAMAGGKDTSMADKAIAAAESLLLTQIDG